MNLLRLAPLALAAMLAPLAGAAGKIVVTATHALAAARPGEVVVVPWAEIVRVVPEAKPEQLVVRDAAGASLPYQFTNSHPNDPRGRYDDVLFQHDFAAGEKRAVFTIEPAAGPVPPFPARVFARYVPERLDDFAWENDRIAHRTYGPALAAQAEPVGSKEVLVTSGLDVWSKRVRYPIVDAWYNKGSDRYHTDEGQGLDMYSVGTARGCGGTGVWDGRTLRTSHNWKTWRVIANGPIRAIFELTYAPWHAGNGVMVSEVKRFTVDAGRNLDCVESTFTFTAAAELTVAIGISKHRTVPGTVTRNAEAGWLSLWEKYPKVVEAELGTGVVFAPGALGGFAEDEANHLALVKVRSGEPVRYYPGAGWTRSGDFAGEADWNAYLAAFAARLAAPVAVTIEGAR